ncbi:MAG: hypothetical protein KIT81_16125 [Alphaproteobacteria bacterium]|nr:hypothetical protein [Alphaproteobacteria bacterium]
MGGSITAKVAKLATAIESHWALALLIKATFFAGGFALPAWAVSGMHQFDQYAPLSWIIAGAAGLAFVVIGNLVWQWSKAIRVKALFDARAMASGSLINPLDKTFEGKRIFVNDFTLPSLALIDDKTFIDCEIIGPANLFWPAGNMASEIRPPRFDAVYLEPGVKFFNGITLRNCIFRRCSFQRITLLIGADSYDHVKHHEAVNWMTIRPDSQANLSLPNIQAEDSDTQSPEEPESETRP